MAQRTDIRDSLGVLEAIMVCSFERGYTHFPLQKQLLLDEVANATLAHVGAEARKVRYSQTWGYQDMFEDRLWKYFEPALKNAPRRLPAVLEEGIMELVKPIERHPVASRPYDDTQLYEIAFGAFRLLPLDFVADSAGLDYDRVVHVQDSVLPRFAKERADLDGIGRHVRAYIKEDLNALREQKGYSL